MNADTGTYSLNGVNNNLLRGRLIPADTVSYIVSGIPTGLRKTSILVCDRRTYNLNGTETYLYTSTTVFPSPYYYMFFIGS